MCKPLYSPVGVLKKGPHWNHRFIILFIRSVSGAQIEKLTIDQLQGKLSLFVGPNYF
jgi:hypothetical protein